MGPNTLCSVHYKIMRKNKLHMAEEVTEYPLHPAKNTELLFLNNQLKNK